MAIFSDLSSEDRLVVDALLTGKASKAEQKEAADIICQEMHRADDNAKKLTALENQIRGLERAIAVMK